MDLKNIQNLMFDDFTFSKFAFVIRIETPMRLPIYKGGTLRGGFGYALKRTACVCKGATCSDCMLNEKCVYSYIFETSPPKDSKFLRNFSDIPHPFIIEPPLDGKTTYNPSDHLLFNVMLIGKTIELLPYFIMSFEALGRSGMGVNRGKFSVLKVKSGENEVYDGEQKTLSSNPYIQSASDLSYQQYIGKDKITLSLLTPLRMQQKDKLTDQPDFHVLIRTLIARLYSLAYFHCGITLDLNPKGLISEAEKVSIESNNTHWHDWQRYSTRKQYEMKLGGLIGEVTYTGDIEQFIPLLLIGEHIHVGKGTSFGLGKYDILSKNDG